MGLENMMKTSMLSVSCAASVEAEETDIEPGRVVLKFDVSYQYTLSLSLNVAET